MRTQLSFAAADRLHRSAEFLRLQRNGVRFQSPHFVLYAGNLDDEPEERPLGVVRGVYEDACRAMAEGFTMALVKANWTVPASLHQTHIYSDVVAERPKPVAYFLVDAMRFEMGVELAERLPKTTEVGVRHAIGALPSITPIGRFSWSTAAERNGGVGLRPSRRR